MPSNSKLFLKPFIGGLNTEGSDTDDLVLNTSEELNCTILPEGKRGRRYGMNIEKDGKWIDVGEPIRTHAIYYWNNVYSNVSYIVVQINRKLYIYENIAPISTREPIYVYEIPVQDQSLINEPVSIVGVSNLLFVVGKWFLPFVLKYDVDLGRFIDPKINNLKYRDINGIDDGFKVDDLPFTMTARHLYNLKNQGWDKEIYDPENKKTYSLLPTSTYNGKFFEEYAANYGVGRYPANNMQWFVGKEKSGKYNTSDLLNQYFGNTPAPKGHFILDYVSRDRQRVSGIDISEEEEQTVTSFHFRHELHRSAAEFNMQMTVMGLGGEPTKEWLLKQPDGVGDSFPLPANIKGTLSKIKVTINDDTIVEAFDGLDYSVAEYYYSNAKYRGRGHSVRGSYYVMAIPFKIEIVGYDSEGTPYTIYSQDANFSKENPVGTAQTYEITIENPQEFARYSVDLFWGDALTKTPDGLSLLPYQITADVDVIGLNGTEVGPNVVEGLPVSDLLTGAVSKVEAFGGRIFYLVGNTLLFSQTLKQGLQNYEKCYQDADPTSEEVSDILATDGGMIQLLTLGKGKSLKAFNRGVVVFGDQEITGVLSPLNYLFTATEYDIVKIADVGVTGEYSPVSTDDSIYFWSNHGIYIISLVENNIVCHCITNQTINAYYMNISNFSKNNVIGSYDGANNRIIWMYPTSEAGPYKLDKGLVYDLNYKCFMPITVDSGSIVRDLNGKYVGVYDRYKSTVNNDKVLVKGEEVFSTDGELIGYKQSKYLTDISMTKTVTKIKPTIAIRAEGKRVIAGKYNVVVKTDNDVEYDRNSSLIYMGIDGNKFTFADFNDREFRDWDVSPYESYMVSRPISLGDTYFNKQTPIMQTLFNRTEEYELNIDKNFVRLKEPIMMSSHQHHVGPSGYVVNMSPTQNKMYVTNCILTLNSIEDSFHSTTKVSRGFRIDCYYTDEDGIERHTFGSARTKDESGIIELLGEYIPKKLCSNLRFEILATTVNNVYVTSMNISGVIEGFSYEYNTPKITSIDDITLKGITRGIKSGEEIQFNIPLLESDKVYTGTVEFNANTYDKKSNLASETWHADLYSGSVKLHQFKVGKHPVTFEGYGLFGDDGEFNIKLTNFEGPKPFDYIDCKYGLKAIKYKKEHVHPALNISKYSTGSGSYIRMRWGWSLRDGSNRWDMQQNAYRPQKDFLHDNYVESRLHIRGRGKAFQVEIRNDDNKDFRLLGLNIITRSAQ